MVYPIIYRVLTILLVVYRISQPKDSICMMFMFTPICYGYDHDGPQQLVGFSGESKPPTSESWMGTFFLILVLAQNMYTLVLNIARKHHYWYGYGSIPIDTFLVEWTSIYQLFWGEQKVPGFWPIPIYVNRAFSIAILNYQRLAGSGSDMVQLLTL